MGRPALTKAQKQDVRAEIRRVALELFREGGLGSISMRAVAARLDMSTANLYSYFDNQRALFEFLWREPVARANAALAQTAQETPEPMARIERLLETYVAFAHANPEIYRGAFLYVAPQPPQRKFSANQAPLAALLAEAIREAQDAGHARAGDAELMAQSLWASVHGAFALPNNIGQLRFYAPEALAKQTIALLCSGLRVL